MLEAHNAVAAPGADNDALRERLDSLLRTCIQCGLCLPHCATYLATANETRSPRGRLLLLGEVLRDAPAPVGSDVLAAFDDCLGCHACEATCPSGITGDLLDHARDLAADGVKQRSLVPARVLDSRPLLAWLGTLATMTRGVLRRVAGAAWRQRLEGCPAPLRLVGRMLGTVPAASSADRRLIRQLDTLTGQRTPTVDDREADGSGPSVAFFRGCANAALLPGVSRRLRSLLRASGCLVVIPAGQDCCGALAAHTGRHERRAILHQRNQAAFADAPACDYIVVEAAGCGLELRGYPDPPAGTVRDASVLLDSLDLPAFGTVPLRVALHDPCHALHGQGIAEQPRRLLGRVPGLSIQPVAEASVCCGSGGAYALRHPELSAAMGRRKARLLAASGAQLVVTTNPGCLGQIADGLALEAPQMPIVPLSDLLWYAWMRGVVASARNSA